jgi:hypothetical protein
MSTVWFTPSVVGVSMYMSSRWKVITSDLLCCLSLKRQQVFSVVFVLLPSSRYLCRQAALQVSSQSLKADATGTGNWHLRAHIDPPHTHSLTFTLWVSFCVFFL